MESSGTDSPTVRCPNPCCSRRGRRLHRTRSLPPAAAGRLSPGRGARPRLAKAPPTPSSATPRTLCHAPALLEPWHGPLKARPPPRRRGPTDAPPLLKGMRATRRHWTDRPPKGPPSIFQIPWDPFVHPIPAPPWTVFLFLFPFNHSLKGQDTKTPTQEVFPPLYRREN